MDDTTLPVLVTGASGNVGRHVAAGLRAAGRQVRAADPPGFDFTDPATWAPTFEGVSSMFLVRPPQLSDVRRDMLPALDAARAAGVRHVVLLSLQGADRNRVVPHARLESWLRDSGLAWTFVRPSFFMENLSTTHASDIRDRDEIVVPAGGGRTAFVAASDVAAVAVQALLDPSSFAGTAWTPTGPQALTYDEVAQVLGDVLGRRIRYTRPGALAYARHASSVLGMPRAMVAVTTAIYTVARVGRAAGLTDDVATVTGRPPVALPEWARVHADVWRRGG